MTDQFRLDHMGCLPGSKMATPNIDRLAESLVLTNCNSINPICTPARAGLLTGRYSHQVNMTTMSGDLSQGYPTYMQALQKAGYYTAGIGKFHWLQGWDWYGKLKGGHPLSKMHEEFKAYGMDKVWQSAGKSVALRNQCDYCEHLAEKGILDEYKQHVRQCGAASFFLDLNSRDKIHLWPFAEEDYIDVVTADKIIETIEEQQSSDQPFFIFGSFCGPHYPYDPPQRYIDQFELEKEDDFIPGEEEISEEYKQHLFELRRAYKGMIALIDDQIGRILDTLEKQGILEDTVILFSADHGESMGDHFRMQKSSPFAQSVVVPGAIRHPDHLCELRNHSPVELTDFTATLLDVAGLDAKEVLSRSWPSYNDIIPCRSLMPMIRGEQEQIRDFAFSECDAKWHDNFGKEQPFCWQMIKSREWTYIRHHDMRSQDPENFCEEYLFDRLNDPDELENKVANPELNNILELARKRRDWVMTTTPTAQTSWAWLE